jgi:hypothetical protein
MDSYTEDTGFGWQEVTEKQKRSAVAKRLENKSSI